MIRLKHIEAAVKPNFVWSEESDRKPLQTSEEWEGSKDLARDIFVGVADMFGHHPTDVQEYLGMEYETHRYKLAEFKRKWREVIEREKEGLLLFGADDHIKKFYIKVSLVSNYIRIYNRQNPFLSINKYANN